jgi:small conductance mechanosensitive channel
VIFKMLPSLLGEAPPNPVAVDPVQTVLKSLATLWKDTLNHLPLLVAGLLVLILTWVASWIVNWILSSLLSRWRMRRSLKDLLRNLAGLGVWVVGILIAAVVTFPGMTPAKVFTILGVGSIAIGFAFKDIFENFFAGVLILWRFPFDPGDYIQCGDIEGTVEDTTIRMTAIRQTNGELVVIPNGVLFKNAVNIWTNLDHRRITIICGVEYEADIATARQTIQKAVSNCQSVNKQKDIEIFAQEFAASSINFEVTWWTGPRPLDERRSRDEVVQQVKSALDAKQIGIPFPQRTLNFKDRLLVEQQSDEKV